MLRPVISLAVAIVWTCGGLGGASDHWATHPTLSTTDAFLTHATWACSLACSVAQQNTFQPSLAAACLFISLVLYM